MKNLLIANCFLIFIFYSFALSDDTVIKDLKSDIIQKQKNENIFSFGVVGFIQYGECRGTAIAPQNNPIDNANVSYEMGYGAGLNIQYKFNEQWSVFIETNYSDRRILCARKDEYGYGTWVAEMTGNTLNNYLGPFDDDVYFYMSSFIIKPGVKYYISDDDNIKPWFAIGVSLYPWNAAYMNSNRQKIYGQQQGFTVDLSILNLGFDFNIDFGKNEKIILSLYMDLGSPSVKLTFNNLFMDGWTYNDNDGEDLVGTYKFGILMTFEL